MMDYQKFGRWLSGELDKREMSQSDLSRAAGVTRATINGVITGRRQPGSHLLAAISKALIIPLEDLYQVAGILPPSKKESYEKLNMMFSKLSTKEQNEVIDYINFRLEKQNKGNNESFTVEETQQSK